MPALLSQSHPTISPTWVCPPACSAKACACVVGWQVYTLKAGNNDTFAEAWLRVEHAITGQIGQSALRYCRSAMQQLLDTGSVATGVLVDAVDGATAVWAIGVESTANGEISRDDNGNEIRRRSVIVYVYRRSDPSVKSVRRWARRLMAQIFHKLHGKLRLTTEFSRERDAVIEASLAKAPA